jgi:hypothetical protein
VFTGRRASAYGRHANGAAWKESEPEGQPDRWQIRLIATPHPAIKNPRTLTNDLTDPGDESGALHLGRLANTEVAQHH